MEITEKTGFYHLSWLQRIGFGAGDLAQNLIYQTICMYLLFFYTDVYVLGGDAAKSAGLRTTPCSVHVCISSVEKQSQLVMLKP